MTNPEDRVPSNKAREVAREASLQWAEEYAPDDLTWEALSALHCMIANVHEAAFWIGVNYEKDEASRQDKREMQHL